MKQRGDLRNGIPRASCLTGLVAPVAFSEFFFVERHLLGGIEFNGRRRAGWAAGRIVRWAFACALAWCAGLRRAQ